MNIELSPHIAPAYIYITIYTHIYIYKSIYIVRENSFSVGGDSYTSLPTHTHTHSVEQLHDAWKIMEQSVCLEPGTKFD